jgi:hypothetical protein
MGIKTRIPASLGLIPFIGVGRQEGYMPDTLLITAFLCA